MAARKFIFLKDAPVPKDSDTYFNFYHGNIAPALKKILAEKSAPHTIGLFGSWGSGKSTIIEILNDEIKSKTPVFIFDAWKYQSDALRRTFLIKLKEFIDEVEPGLLEDEILEDIYSTNSSTVTTHRASKKQGKWKRIVNFFKRRLLFLIAAITITIWIILNLVDLSAHWLDALKSIFLVLGSISFVVEFFKPLYEAIIKETASSFLRASKTEMDQVTQTVKRERLESPEEFERKFEDLISKFDRKMVIVFDNLDRVPGNVAISMLSTIKTFLDTQKGKGIVFIIPCDPEAIEAQITNYYSDGDGEDGLLVINPSDYLRKVFNLVLWVPEFVTTDLEEYTKKCLQATGEISKLFDDDVALVINAAFSKNPREIVQFVNNLVALTVTAQQTKVRDVIEGNMPYLAKVLVLRQVYPTAYKLLKKNWFRPEKIYSDDGSALAEFMNLTSRITVENAEPFLYLKDPEGSRGLVNPNGLRNALALADELKAIEIAKNEKSHGQLVQFIIDLLQKYADQKEVLLNIFNTHFKIIEELNITVSSSAYYEQIPKTLDTQLWQKYQQVNVGDIFSVLQNVKTPKKLVKAVVDRYMLAIGANEAELKYIVDVLTQMKNYPSILTREQLGEVVTRVEANSSQDQILEVFDTDSSQESFVSSTAFQNYVQTLDYANIARRLKILTKYKTYIAQHDRSALIVTSFAGIFNQANVDSSNTGEPKMAIIKAVGPLVKLLRDDIKEQESNEIITSALVSAYNGDSTPQSRVAVVKAMWWIRYLFTPQQQAILLQSINNFFATAAIDDTKDVLSSWDEATTSHFINAVFAQLAPRLVVEPDLRDFVYQEGSGDVKAKLVEYMITEAPNGNEADIEFLRSLGRLSDRAKIVKLLLDKTERLPSNFRPPYYNLVSEIVSIGDLRDIKLAILSQLQTLLRHDDQATQEVGYQFLLKIKSLMSKSDYSTLIESILEGLTQPGKSISWQYRSVFLAISEGFSALSMEDRHKYIAFLLNLLRPERDIQTLQVVIEQLVTISPRLATYETELDLLRRALEAQQGTETTGYIKAELLKLKPRRPGAGERGFWRSLDNIN